MSRTERTELLIGEAGVNSLALAKVLVNAAGGVGGYVCGKSKGYGAEDFIYQPGL